MTQCTVVLSDTQIPYHDKRAMSAFGNMLSAREQMIDKLFQIGDLYDMTAVSRWVDGTPEESGRDMQKELNSGYEFLADIDKAYSGPKEFIMGNHDDRLSNYTRRRSHGLHGIDALQFGTLTGTDEYNWVCRRQPYRVRPDTTAVHGLYVRSKSGHTPHAHLDRFGSNVVHGHTHRAGTVWRTTEGKTRWGMEVGHMMLESKASYTMVPDWQKGFGVLWHDGNRTVPEFVPVRADGSFLFDGGKWKP